MKTYPTGQLSYRNSIVQNFQKELKANAVLVLLSLLFLFSSGLLNSSFATNNYTEIPEPPVSNTWTVSVTLECPLSSGAEAFMESLLGETAGFSGFSDNLSLSSNRQVVTYTLTGPSSELPSNVVAAEITVHDPECGGATNFVVQTDGGASVLIVDEL